MGSRRKGRILAFQALYSWDYIKETPEELCRFLWLDDEKKDAYGSETLVFGRYLLLGALEHLDEIDSLIKSHLEHWDFDRLSRVDLAILRMSIYSLVYQKDIPATVTIDEAIDLAKEFSSDDSYRFVNGVLDGINKDLMNK